MSSEKFRTLDITAELAHDRRRIQAQIDANAGI
jgi:hypothetical protein